MATTTKELCTKCQGNGIIVVVDYDQEIWESVHDSLKQAAAVTDDELEKLLHYFFPMYDRRKNYKFLLDMKLAVQRSNLIPQLRRYKELLHDLPPKSAPGDYAFTYGEKYKTHPTKNTV